MLRRLLTEHRRVVAVVGIALLANLGVYALAVYPLAARVDAARHRASDAERVLRSARPQDAAARALATDKEAAEQELAPFYEKVLPAGVSAANRATYLSLEQLARKTNLQITRRQAAREPVRESSLDRLKMSLVLEGSYENLRRFVHELENAPAFVVIDEMMIDQGRETARPLVLTLSLSTYFRSPVDES